MQVKIVSRRGKAVLVEWEDAVGVHRGILPERVVGDGTDVAFPDLQAAMPYGIPWERLALPTVTMEQFAQAFRTRGIWTEEDLQHNVSMARAAMQEVNGMNLAFLIDSIRRVRENDKP